MLTKVHIIKTMAFPVVMYGGENWTIKKSEHQIIDAFELWCWIRLESLLDSKEIKTFNPKGNQSWILVGWTVEVKLQYFGHLMKKKYWSKVAQSCLILCDPMDCSLTGSSVHGIFQARILEWVAISFSRRSSQPGDWSWVSRVVGRCFAIWDTREVTRNWCFWIVMLEKTLESPLDNKDIKTFNPKGNQSWILVGWTVGRGEASVLWPPDGKSQLIGENLDAGNYWRQREKGVTEDKMDWWHGITDSMDTYLRKLWETVEDKGAWCDIIQCHKELDMTLWLNNNHGEPYVSPM